LGKGRRCDEQREQKRESEKGGAFHVGVDEAGFTRVYAASAVIFRIWSFGRARGKILPSSLFLHWLAIPQIPRFL
jgi:hypothetical protein